MAVEENIELTYIKRITIVNTLGQVIYDASTNTDNSEQVLKRFPEGIYVIKFLTEQGVVTRKIKR